MKILVTGSSGRVGSKLIQDLSLEGHTVIAVDKVPSKNIIEGVEYHTCDITDSDSVGGLLEGVETVVHIATYMHWAYSEEVAVWKANIDATFVMTRMSVEKKVKRFVFASTGEVYPEGNPQYLPIDESHPLLPTSVYGLTKKLAEETVNFYGRVKNIETVILRFPHTQDPEEILDRDSFFSGPRFFLKPKIKQMKFFGNHALVEKLQAYDDGSDKHLLMCGEDGTPYQMHIAATEDSVMGIKLAIFNDKAVGNIYNLGPNDVVKFDEAIPKMSQITGFPVVRFNMPGKALSYITSNNKIKEELGYAPKWTFDKMIDKAAEGWKNKK